MKNFTSFIINFGKFQTKTTICVNDENVSYYLLNLTLLFVIVTSYIIAATYVRVKQVLRGGITTNIPLYSRTIISIERYLEIKKRNRT